MKKLSLFVIVVLVAATSLTGCNAWKGVGTDIKNTGTKMEG